MVRRATHDLLPLPHFPSAKLHDGHRALGRSPRRRLQRHLHRTLVSEVVDALNSLAGSPQAQAASRPVTLAQSCSLKAVAEAVAHAGPPPEGLVGPGALLELRVARGYTDTRVHRAPLDVGALAQPPRGLQPKDLDELVGPSFACEIVKRLSAKLLPKAAQRENGLSRVFVNPRVGKCCPRCKELLLVFFEHVIIVESLLSGNGIETDVSLSMLASQILLSEAPHPVALATGQSFARLCADTNDPICVSGVHTQVAFYAMGMSRQEQSRTPQGKPRPCLRDCEYGSTESETPEKASLEARP